eukprot:TRINITY_DN37301_c0_g1_i1.p1 TRINITY_DN37301_c0_g1~~TRINITY_DN37301_c0_g1_i1.p1  ORF type:complete len:120 (-),score=11.52 TRINITY_DN37301_c0_g1_i1:35-394(-)
MVGFGGGLRGGEGCGHRPLTGCVGGRRTANFAGFGYVRGHPGDSHCPNPPTYQTTRQLGHDLQPLRATVYRSTKTLYESGCLDRSGSMPALQGRGKPSLAFHELQATRIVKSLPAISPW